MDKFIQILKTLKLPVVAVIVLVIVLIFTRECNKEVCPPKGSVLVTQGFIDTLIYVANIPPDTLYDTTIIKGDIIYITKEVPVPTPVDPQTNFYADSIVNDSISIWVEITVKGVITKWDWRYQPTIIEKEKIITISRPIPVRYEVPISKSGLYGSLGVGGNQSAFILSGGVDYINRRDRLYGVQYMRFGQQDYYLFKIGTKIKF